MKIISFGWTHPAITARVKTVTRRCLNKGREQRMFELSFGVILIITLVLLWSEVAHRREEQKTEIALIWAKRLNIWQKMIKEHQTPPMEETEQQIRDRFEQEEQELKLKRAHNIAQTVSTYYGCLTS